MILKGRTTCSGVKCPMEGMCRNKAGLCGAGIGFCSPNSVWESSCPDKIPVNVPTAIISINPTTSPATVTTPSFVASVSLVPLISLSLSAALTLSALPTQSNSPSHLPSVSETTTDIAVPSSNICREHGSVGATTTATNNTPRCTRWWAIMFPWKRFQDLPHRYARIRGGLQRNRVQPCLFLATHGQA